MRRPRLAALLAGVLAGVLAPALLATRANTARAETVALADAVAVQAEHIADRSEGKRSAPILARKPPVGLAYHAAAVLVPSAPAAIVLDEPLDRIPQATVFGHDSPADRAASANASLSVSEQLALVRGDSSTGGAQPALVRADGPDGKVSNVALRRDANVAPTSYSTAAPQSGGGSEFDWTASGLGAGSAGTSLARRLIVTCVPPSAIAASRRDSATRVRCLATAQTGQLERPGRH